jgi:hypothetical protein
MIDVQDCDARLPSSGDPTDLYMDELVRLSIILGRVQKTIYRCVAAFRLILEALSELKAFFFVCSPSGLTFIRDEQLYELLADMQQWQEGLPEHLKFRGPDTSHEGGKCLFLQLAFFLHLSSPLFYLFLVQASCTSFTRASR